MLIPRCLRSGALTVVGDARDGAEVALVLDLRSLSVPGAPPWIIRQEALVLGVPFNVLNALAGIHPPRSIEHTQLVPDRLELPPDATFERGKPWPEWILDRTVKDLHEARTRDVGHPAAFRAEVAQTIFWSYWDGLETKAALARQHGVSYTTIDRITRRETYWYV